MLPISLVGILVALCAPSETALSTTDQQLCLDVHNQYRASEGASNMLQMEWDTNLANVAQSYAQLCNFQHNSNRSTQYVMATANPAATYVGENLFVTTADESPGLIASAIQAWYNEKTSYDFSSRSCSGVCGHYTQVVWSQTYLVGCGSSYCRTVTGFNLAGTLVVCNYAPGGNIVGQSPYTAGSACSMCPSQWPKCYGNSLCSKNNTQTTVPAPTVSVTMPTTTPVVNSITPNYGSLSGQTQITISGTGFSMDQFAFNDPTLGNRVNFTRLDGMVTVSCDVIIYLTSSSQIVCTIKAPPDGLAGTYAVQVTVDGKSTSSPCKTSNCQFTFQQSNTPTVLLTSPLAAPIGQNVTISGNFFTTSIQQYDANNTDSSGDYITRVLVGGQLCSLTDDNMIQYAPVPVGTAAGTTSISCLPEVEGRVASMNISMFLAIRGGSSTPLTSLTIDNNLMSYNFQTYAEISSVVPNIGSSAGGTLISIYGKNFGASLNTIQVLVGGIPCSVVNVTDAVIQCITGPKPPTSTYYPGGRGLLREVWFNGFQPSLDAIKSLNSSQANPQYRRSIIESSLSQTQYGAEFGESVTFSQRMTGFFVPPVSSLYTFSILTDDPGRFSLSPNMSAESKTTVAYSDYYTPTWTTSSTQISAPIYLEAGSYHYLEALGSNNYGPWALVVGAKIHSLNWTSSQANADQEVQRINISSPVALETHEIRILGSPPRQLISITPNTVGQMNITFGNQTTSPIRTINATAIQSALNALSNVQRIGGVSVFSADNGGSFVVAFQTTLTSTVVPALVVKSDTLSVNVTVISSTFSAPSTFQLGFNNDINNAATPRLTGAIPVSNTSDAVSGGISQLFTWVCQKSQPFILFNDSYETDATTDVSNEPYCGKYSSLNHPSSLWVLQGNQQSYTSLVSSYPYVCLAYRGGVPSSLYVNIGYLSTTSVWTTAQVDLFVNATISRDGAWHFDCFDIRPAISANAAISKGQFQSILQVSFSSSSSAFWIDEFTITRNPITYSSRTPAVRPAGIFVNSISVVTTVPSKPVVNLSFPLLPDVTSADLLSGLQVEAVRYTVTYTVLNCGTGMGPITANVPVGQSGSVAVRQLVQGSPPVSGTFSLSFQGYKTGSLAASVAAYTLQTQLQNSFGSGQFSVSQGGTCAGYYWDITWVTVGGDQPLIVANGTGLQGNNVTITVTALVNGGVYIRPFRGDMLRLPYTMPQVEVLVNKIPSSCPQNNCGFNFTDSVTPKVFPFTQQGHEGDTLAINGTQFGNDPLQIVVQIGSVNCPVIAANNTYITCTVGPNSAGAYDVTVGIIGVGVAQGKGLFVYRLVASTITPTAGSVGGGENIHITGFGFKPFGPLSTMGAHQYWSTVTLTNITTPQAQAFVNGSTTLPMFVLIGQELCEITMATYTSITCSVTAVLHQPGPVNMTVVVGNQQSMVPINFEFSIDHTPVIYGVYPVEGSVLGGTDVTISGDNLLGSVQVNIGGSTCTVLSVSKDHVNCRTTPHSPGLYPVLVAINDSGIAVLENALGSSFLAMFQYRLEINSISPSVSSILGGQMLSIEGQGFGNSSNTMVTIGANPCSIVSVQSSHISCINPSSVTTHVVTYLPSQGAWDTSQLNDLHIGDTLQFAWRLPSTANYLQVTVTYSQGAVMSGPSNSNGTLSVTLNQQGSTVTINTFVSNLGQLTSVGPLTVGGFKNSSANVAVTVGGFSAVTNIATNRAIRSTSQCIPEPQVPSSPSAIALYYLDCATPTVSSVAPVDATWDTPITISGWGFSTNPSDNAVAFGGYTCLVSNSSETQVVCTFGNSFPPSFTPLPLTMNIVGLGNALVQASPAAIVLRPYISSIYPVQGSTAGGTLITILGEGLSSANLTVQIANSKCAIVSQSYQSISCIAGPYQGGSVAAQVMVLYSVPSAVTSAVCRDGNNCMYMYQQAITPTVTSITPTELVGVTTLSINGSHFSPNVTLNKVKVGVYDCPCVLAAVDYIQCVMNSPPAGLYNLTVTVLDVVGDQNVPLGMALIGVGPLSSPLRVTDITPSSGSTQGGTVVTIGGVGFPVLPASVFVTVGNKSCQVITSTYTTITCSTPAQPNGSYKVFITYNTYLASAPVNFTYSQSLTPNITNISPLSGQQGDIITVTGTLFPTDSTQVTVSFNGSVCTVNNSSSTTITCTLGPNFAGSYPATVQVAGKGYAKPVNSTLQFKYTLIVTSVMPSNGSLAGMNTLTVYGVGFNPTSTVVAVCGRVCGMASDPPQLTMLSCIAPTYTGTLPQSGQVTCNVTVTSQNSTVVLPGAYSYSRDLTPMVTSVNRTRGGTAGGSVLLISGSGLTGVANVTIAGIVCDVLYQDFAQTIICETGPSGVTVRAQVMVYIAGMGFAQSAGVTFYYVDLWSSRFTWGGDPVPADGEFVVIPSGQTLLLDTSTPVLSFLLIQGQLIFDDTQPFISLKAENILVTSGGLLQVGTEQQPYMSNAEIVLYGHVLSTELPVYGAKTLAVREGTLELHGKPLNVTWTRLSRTANPGDTTIYLTQPVDWQVGGSIVVAATGFVQTENEDATIASISPDGMSLTLAEPLNFTHISQVQTIAGRTIETRAEVGYLTRNVVVRGNVQTEWHRDIPACPTAFRPGQFEIQSCFQGRFGAESINDMFGSQIMIHAAMQNNGRVAARIEYVEVTHAGQAFRLGRYPIHFHLNGNVSGSYVRGCAIHHTFNRAVTIHAVNYLLVEKNVAYNILGHAYFLEDGVEVGNVIQDNLGIFVRASSSLLNVDITPATFWIVNPNNTVRRNAAAGGTHFGYWYRLSPNPTGPSATSSVCPRNIPLGEFSNNSAHSFGWYGLWVFPDYHPQVGGGCATTSPQPVFFDNLLSWHNNQGVEFTEIGALHLRNSVLLDNNLAGMVVVRVDALWGSGAALKGTLIVGQSSITPDQCTLTGIRTPESYFLTVSNVTFVNFYTPDCVPIRACSHCKVNDGGFETRFEGLTFINCTQVTQWQWQHEHLHRDMDGSLTGIRGGSLTPTHALLPQNCFDHSGTIGVVPGSVCPAGFQFGRFAVFNPLPSSLTFMSAAMVNSYGNITLPFVKKRIFPANGYMALLSLNATYQFQWPQSTYITNVSYSTVVSGLTPYDYFVISYQYPQPLDYSQVNGITTASAMFNQTLVTNPSRASTGSYFIDANNTLYYVVKGLNTIPSNVGFSYQTYNCYYVNCTPPAPTTPAPPIPAGRPNVTRNWSSLFPSNLTATTSIFINCSLYVIVDVSTIVVDNLTICGGLEFVDGLNYVLDANLILILGTGRLVVGYPDAPYTSSLIITLHGTTSSPEFQFKFPAQGPVVGAKAIGVFGQISLHGKQRSTWTRLAQPALVGQSSLTLLQSVDWNPNDTIVVTSTSFDPSETEVFRVVSVSGAVVQLNTTLKYNHAAESEANGTLSYSVRAEVGLLTRNVVIRGDPSTTGFGCRVLVGTYQDLTGTVYAGSAQLDGVEISGCGQLGFNEAYDPRYSLAFLDASLNNYVNGCSIHDGYNIGLGAFGTDSMVIIGNVIHVTVGPAMTITGSNHQVIQNLASLTLFPGTYGGANQPRNSVWTANFDLVGTQSLTLVGNSAAGGARAGYHFNGEACSSTSSAGIVMAQAPSSTIYDNVAHSSLHGIHLGYTDGQRGGCAYFNRFTIFSCFHYGLFSYGMSGAWITNSVFVNNFAAIYVSVIGPLAVSHIAGDKPVLIQDTIIVGASPVYQSNCAGDSKEPPIASHPVSFFGIKTPYGGGHVGVVIPTFTSKPGLFPKFPWFNIDAYPAINGLTEMRNVTFAHFKTRCSAVVDSALITNPNAQDGIHPTTMRQINLYDVEVNASLFIHQPRLEAINPSDCVDMDCDGFKKVLIRDLDGTFTRYRDGKLHTIISRAEFAWGDQTRGIGDYRIPPAMLTFPNGSKQSVELTYPAKGIVRGTTFGSSGNCAYNAMWNAYLCSQLDHLMLVLESLDSDTETRRLSPVGVAANGFIDLVNGPEDFGWCGGYTCQERISTFYIIVASGFSYTIGLTSTNPQNSTLRLLNANSSQTILVGIINTNPQRLDIYYQGNYVRPTNADPASTSLKYLQSPPASRASFTPLITDAVGTNFYDRQWKQLYVVIKGSNPITIVTTPVVQVSLSLFVTTEEFFDDAALVSNIAFLLGIPSNKIRIVNVVRESAAVGKRQAGSTDTLQLAFEIGDPPVQQMGSTPTSTTNVTSGTNITNSTGPSTNTTNTVGNTTASTEQTSLNYTSLVVLTTKIANAIQTGQLASALNGTIAAATIVQPVAPPPPPPPAATNLTGGPQPGSLPENSTLIPLGVLSVQQANSTVQQPNVVLSIPTDLRVAYLPVSGTEGIPFQSPIRIAMYDNSGAMVTTLGVGASWICTAKIVSGPSAAFLTSFTANFSNGTATFSKLVMSHPGTYTLQFAVTYPENAQFNVTTRPVTIAARQLTLVLQSLPSSGVALVPVTSYPILTLVDSQTGALVQDLSWRNSTWYASAAVMSTSGVLYQSWTVPLQAGVAVFKDVVVAIPGSYVLVFSVMTDPSSGPVPSSITTPFMVDLVPIARFVIVYQVSYTDVVLGREDQFKSSFKATLQSSYPQITIYNITVTSGSIVVTFFAGAQTIQNIQDFVSTLSSSSGTSVLSFTFNGQTLVPSNITQDQAYPVSSAAPSSTKWQLIVYIVVPIAVVLCCIVAVICCAGLWCCVSTHHKDAKVPFSNNEMFENQYVYSTDPDVASIHLVSLSAAVSTEQNAYVGTTETKNEDFVVSSAQLINYDKNDNNNNNNTTTITTATP